MTTESNVDNYLDEWRAEQRKDITSESLLRNMNPRLFAEQRLFLIGLALNYRIPNLTQEEEQLLDGLINFTDAIADHLTYELDMDAQIHSEDGED
jgi:hypothetical protein